MTRTLVVVLCRSVALLALALPCAWAETFQASVETAYAVSSDSADASTADKLYRVNLLTGESTMIGSLGTVAYEDVESLAIGSRGAMFGIDDDTKTLLSIAISSGRATSIGSNGNSRLATTSPQDPSIAFTCDGSMFAVARNSRSFYRVDATTGAFELIGNNVLGASIQDLSWTAGVLYGLGDQGLYRITTTSGASSLVGNYGGGVNFVEGGGLAVDSEGQLWAVGERRNSRGDLQPSQIYRINRETGAATWVANSPVGGFESLAIGAPSCALVGTAISAIPTLSISSIGLFVLLMLGFGLSRLSSRS